MKTKPKLVSVTVTKDRSENNSLRVIRFTADYCQPCKQLSKYLETTGLDEMVDEVVDITIDQLTPAQFNIRGIPALVLVEDGDNGFPEVVDTLVGFNPSNLSRVEEFFNAVS